jgi:Uma2 family endonuclease
MTTPPTPEERVLLYGVSWQTYKTLLVEFDERPIRLTYDEGNLEIRTSSYPREHWAGLLGRCIEILTLELNIPLHSGRYTTLHREDVQRGLESDGCYWIANERRMRGVKEYDMTRDPPPDLVIEIELPPPRMDRLAIYASLGVREVWRFDGEQFRVSQLGADGKHAPSNQSLAFPFLPLHAVVRFLRASGTKDQTSLMRWFSRWVREHLLPTRQQAKKPTRGQGSKKGPREPR